MREIEFRGKRKDIGEWVYGDLYHHASGAVIITVIKDGVNVNYEVIPETVGEYTGLKEKNGIEKIYEGDVLVFNFPYNPIDKSKRKIIFEEGAFQAIRNGGYVSLSRNFPFLNSETLDAEIAGNIHDNPKLLGWEKIEEESI